MSRGLSELLIILKSSVIAKATLAFRSALLHAKVVKFHWQPRIQTIDRYNKLKEKRETTLNEIGSDLTMFYFSRDGLI